MEYLCLHCNKVFQHRNQRSRHTKSKHAYVQVKIHNQQCKLFIPSSRDHISNKQMLSDITEQQSTSGQPHDSRKGVQFKIIQKQLEEDFSQPCSQQPTNLTSCQSLTPPPSQDPSFKTKSSELGGVLNSDQFNMNTVTENIELKKEVQMLKQHISKLEKKLEVKECDLVQLRGQLGGLEVQGLKIELAVVKSQLTERDVLIKEWKQKEKQWLNMFGQVYNLSKDPSFYKDLKKALDEFQGSLQNSKVNSLHQSFANSCDNSEPLIQSEENDESFIGVYEDLLLDKFYLANTNTSQGAFDSNEIIPEYGFNCKAASNLEEDRLDTNTKLNQILISSVACKFCNKAIVGPQIRWEIDSVIPAGALIDHMKQCPKFLVYQARITKFSNDWKEKLTKQDALLQTQLAFALESADVIVKTLRLSRVFQ